MSRIVNLILIISIAGITACGGGGGSDTPPANRAPTVSAPSNFTAVEETQVQLAGSATDSDGSVVSYQWAQTAGTPTVTLANENTSAASFTAPAVSSDTQLTFTLTATDDDGESGTDTVVVTISPDQAPVAVAPMDFQAVENTIVTLSGAASSDDVAIVGYLWEQVSGDALTLENANTESASFTAPDMALDASADYGFRLTVTDSVGATATDEVIVTVIDTPPTVNVVGTVTFDLIGHTNNDALDYGNITQSAARGVTVELLNGAGSTILQTTTTDSNGDYSFEVDPSTNYIVRVKSELKTTGTASWDFTVVDNTSDDAVYAMDSATVSVQAQNVTVDLNAPSGWTGSSYGDPRVAGPFAILDGVYQSIQKVIAVDSDAQFPALRLHWSANNVNSSGQNSDACLDYDSGQIGTSFYQSAGNCPGIYILGGANSDTDEYDDHVIIHEWGHYFEDKFSRSDSLGGSHSGSDRLDMRVALGEGYGNALSGIVTDDPIYRDSFGNSQGQGFSINVESNPGSNQGWFSESSVQSLLYDFYDSNADGSDSIALGFGPLYEVLVNGERTTDAFTSIFSFANQLKIESPSNASAIDVLLSSQSIIAADDFGSTETNTGGNSDSIPVYKPITIGGASVELCFNNSNGEYNKLGNRQYIKLDTTTNGSYSITANGQSAGDDPDVLVYQQGVAVFRSEENGDESFNQTLNAGTYVLEVYEWLNVDGNDQTSKSTCVDVSASAN